MWSHSFFLDSCCVTCWNSYGGGFDVGSAVTYNATAIVAQSVARVRSHETILPSLRNFNHIYV